jgi:transposase
MAKPILEDELWAMIQPLLPPPKRRRKRYPGRKPIGQREALSAILFVLKTGLPWEHLSQELGSGSGMTAWRRLHTWHKKGVWKKIHAALLAHLQAADQIDWSRTVVDSRGPRGKNGPQPIRSRQARQQAPSDHRRRGRSAGRDAYRRQRSRRHATDAVGRGHPAGER